MQGRRLFLRGGRCYCGGTLRGSARGEMRPISVNPRLKTFNHAGLYIFVRHVEL